MRFLSIFLFLSILLGHVQSGELEKQTPSYIFWGLLGSYPSEDNLNPYKLTRDDHSVDAGALLYSIRRDFKTVAEISDQTGIPEEAVSAKLQQLLDCDLVVEENGACIVNFPFWDAPLRDRILELGSRMSGQIVDILRAEMPELRKLVASSTLADQGYTWDDVALIVIGGLLLDTGLNDRGLRKREIFDKQRDTPERPGGYRYWYRAVEGGWGPYWKFGHNQRSIPDHSAWFCHFYGQIKGRRMNWRRAWDLNHVANKTIMLPLVQKGSLRVNQVELPDPYADSLDATLQKMLDAGVVKIKDGTIYPAFPIFQERDIELLFSRIDRICARIIDSVYIPFRPELEKEWLTLAPEKWRIESVDKFFLREVYDRPYNLVLHAMIEDGLLPPAPVEPPFGYFGIRGKFDVL